MCLYRGCCLKEGDENGCYFPNVGMANITKVHVIHGCHFDAGFVDTTVNIVNRYFDEIFPRVYKVSEFNADMNSLGCHGLRESWRNGANEVHDSVVAHIPLLRLSSESRDPLSK